MRPDLLVLGKGLTGGLPADVGHRRERPRVRRVPRPRPRRADPLPRALLRRERARGGGRAAPPRAARRAWDVLDNVRARSDELRALLDDRIAPLPAVARGAAAAGSWAASSSRRPTDGLRWGRRVCAAAVERGVLLRPLGDVVVLMPPLTITSPELHRIVAHARRRPRRRDRMRHDGPRAGLGRLGGTWTARIRDAGRWREPRRSTPPDPAATVHRDRLDAAGPDGEPRRDGRPVVSFASNDYLGLTQHPAVVAGRARCPRPLGHRRRLGAADRRLAPGARRARVRARGLEGHRARRCSSPPASPPTSACSPRSPAPTCSCAPTS